MNDDFFKTQKAAIDAILDVEYLEIPKIETFEINLDDIINPNIEQVELMKEYIKLVKNNNILLVDQNNILAKQVEDEKQSAKRSKRYKNISYVFSFVMMIIAIVSIFL